MADAAVFTISAVQANGALKIQVESGGLKLTKRTTRTQPWLVLTVGRFSTQWDAKAKDFVARDHLDIHVVRGSAQYPVARKAFDRMREVNRGDSRGVVLLVADGDTYRIRASSMNVRPG